MKKRPILIANILFSPLWGAIILYLAHTYASKYFALIAILVGISVSLVIYDSICALIKLRRTIAKSNIGELLKSNK